MKKMLQHRAKVAEKMRAKNLEIVRNWLPKTYKMEARTLPNRAQRAPRRGQDAPKTEKEDRPNITTLGAFAIAVF